jgi:hypothetical protein
MQCRRTEQGTSPGGLIAYRSDIGANALTCRDANSAKYHPITQGDEAATSDLDAGVDQQEVRR